MYDPLFDGEEDESGGASAPPAPTLPPNNPNAKAVKKKIEQLTDEPFLQTEVDLVCLLAKCPEVIGFVTENIKQEQISDNKIGQLLGRVIKEGQQITPSSVKDILQDPIYELNFDCYKPEDVQRLVDAVLNNWKYRHLTKDLPLKLERIRTVYEAEVLLEKTQGLLAEGKVDFRCWDKSLYEADFLNYQNEKRAGLRTGVKAIDENLFGNFQYGQHIVISADTGTGKTLLATQFLKHFAEVEGVQCALFALEMLRNQMLNRIVPMIDNEINSRMLSEKRVGDIGRVQVALRKFKDIPFYIIDNVHGIENIYRQIRVLARRGVRVFAIDYLQLAMHDPTSVKEIEMITKQLKVMANTLDILIFTVCQFHRKDDTKMFAKGIVKRRPMLSDLKGGSAIEQNADRVFFLYIPQEFDGENDAYDYQHIEIILAKDRNGKKFIHVITLVPSICTFFDNDETKYPFPVQKDFEEKKQKAAKTQTPKQWISELKKQQIEEEEIT